MPLSQQEATQNIQGNTSISVCMVDHAAYQNWTKTLADIIQTVQKSMFHWPHYDICNTTFHTEIKQK